MSRTHAGLLTKESGMGFEGPYYINVVLSYFQESVGCRVVNRHALNHYRRVNSKVRHSFCVKQ
jgi:hypothetical protein